MTDDMHKIELTEAERETLVIAALNQHTRWVAARDRTERLEMVGRTSAVRRDIETLNAAIAKLRGVA